METATVISEGETQTVRLPRGYHLPTPPVQVRQEGDAIVLEPMKPRAWPEGFFDEIHITDPAFGRPHQGKLRAVRTLRSRPGRRRRTDLRTHLELSGERSSARGYQ